MRDFDESYIWDLAESEKRDHFWNYICLSVKMMAEIHNSDDQTSCQIKPLWPS
ncbi:hypothetical protein AVEN_149544-1, partial [Araneus ventricosus]